jgi:hypothetical protein
MPNSSNSSSSGKTAKAKKAKEAKKAEQVRRRANASSVRNNVTAKYGKGRLAAEDRALIQKKLKKIREDEDLNTEEREEAEAKLYAKINGKLAEREAEKAAEKAAKNAEKAAAREAAKSARSAATTARREQKERNLARAKANLKNYLGKSPLKKNVNAFYKGRKNNPGMTAKNYGKAHGLRNATRKLTNSQEKYMKKYKSIAADFAAKGVDGDEFCETAATYSATRDWLERKHKEKGLKHSLSTIIDICGKGAVATPEGSGVVSS